MDNGFLIRCSGLSNIMGKRGELTETAKSYLQAMAKEELFGFKAFEGSKYTEKGLLLEDTAIKLSGLVRGRVFHKNTERRENGYLTGECDIFDDKRKIIIDTKCSWDIGAHPFFQYEAEKKAQKAGYDWQMQGYMWLWDCPTAEIDFILLPTPAGLLSTYDSTERYIDLVNNIPEQFRIKTVVIERDDKAIEEIKKFHEKAKEYYVGLLQEFDKDACK